MLSLGFQSGQNIDTCGKILLETMFVAKSISVGISIIVPGAHNISKVNNPKNKF